MATFEFSAKSLPNKIFINNEYVDSKNDKKLSVYNPKDNKLVSDQVPLSNEHDVDIAVQAAEAAFPAWKRVSAIERRDILLKFAALIEKHGEALSELTRLTLGAPYKAFGAFEVGMAGEVSMMFHIYCAETKLTCVKAFKYNAGWIDKFAGEAFPQENGELSPLYVIAVQN